MFDIQPFMDWQKRGRRIVEISMDANSCPPNAPRFWCYDYDFGVGRYVNSVEEIDPQRWVKEEVERNLSRLKSVDRYEAEELARKEAGV